jgi:stearoyl-CoA desaturase (delta-9 desaturase)
MIYLWSYFGLSSNLRRASTFEIERARQRQSMRSGREELRSPEDQPDRCQLPIMKLTEFVEQANTGRCLVCIHGVIYDVLDFMEEHPGGRSLL